MSGDHNMNQTDSGWRKRQIALDKKAENARELGLDYEPNKTIMAMAREAGICTWLKPPSDVVERIERFAALVRADERKETDRLRALCDELLSELYVYRASKYLKDTTEAIRARGQA
jgi:hypothetical protein